MCGFIEGGRTFNLIWGATTGAICLLIAVPILWWSLEGHATWLFTRALDPHRRLQLAYGIFAMAMAWTNILCRSIPHAPLPWVHPAFLLTTVILAIALGPRVAYVAFFADRPLVIATNAQPSGATR